MEHKCTIKNIQTKILSIAKDIDEFCRQHNIQYYLMGGSALGAIRHKGFIPWDDDLDIFMTQKNYKRFLKLFSEYGNKDKYFLQIENTIEWPLFLSRVCLKDTTFISNEFKHNMKQHHNIFVDIMCLYSAPSKNILRRTQYLAAQLLRINGLAQCDFYCENSIKRFALFISKLVVNKVTKPMLIKYIQRYEGKSSGFVGHYFGRARYKQTVFPSTYLGIPRYVPFEDITLPVFQEVEDYLEMRFGSRWMEIPNIKTRDSFKTHGDFVDLEADYSEYMNKEHTAWTFNE